MPEKPSPLFRSTPWREVIVLCRKCGKKRGADFGPKRKDSLKAALRQALRDNGGRRLTRVIETSCFGICPKHGITALNATHPGTIHIIPTGTDGPAALRTLLGGDTVADRDGIEPA